MQKVAIKQRLQAEVVELQIALGFERCAQTGQIEFLQFGVEQLVFHALGDEFGEVRGVANGHRRVVDFLAQHFLADGVQQQSGGGVAVIRVFFDQRAGG